MCGRYFLETLPELIQSRLKIAKAPVWQSRYNIAPTQQVPALMMASGEPRWASFRWGLVPSWAKDLSIGSKAINARAETLAEKPMFRSAWSARRCMVPASGYFEWAEHEKGKQVYAIRPSGGDHFYFAGLWECWDPKRAAAPEDDGQVADRGRIYSMSIITVAANEALKSLHARMPAMLTASTIEAWLDPQTGGGELKSLLAPAPPGDQRYYPVSPAVGNVRNDAKALIAPFLPGGSTVT